MTTIEWVKNPDGTKGETWNPITGCEKVSPGCIHCYAETMAKRLRSMQQSAYQNVVDEVGWTGKINLVESALEKPLKKKKPATYFVNSMSDLFHKDVPIEYLQKIFEVIKRTPQHTYQILTKRAERLAELAPALEWHPNIWMGVSVESQKYVERIKYLKQVPVRVRFLSCEPLLGSLTLRKALMIDCPMCEGSGSILLDNGNSGCACDNCNASGTVSEIHWVIVGGESGFNHREIEKWWVTDIRDQCVDAGIPFFFKQWGGHTPKAGGRDLDGRTWDEMPLLDKM